ncbi:MAG: SRPBCC family protein, partial [Actinomycetota bacterium]|nr:SRPBCC family protein [Actinomycetota bacterium]
MTLSVVAVQRTIDAEPAGVFDVLADPAKHPIIDGSGSVREVTSSAPRLALGATFGASMRIGVPYRVTNTVVEFEEDRQIAWRHFTGHRWRYVLTPVDGGTLV